MLTSKKEQSAYLSIFCDLGRGKYVDEHGKKMLTASEEEILLYIEILRKEPIYRIQLHSDGTIQTVAYDLMDGFSPELNNFYESVDVLPKWVQDKLAVLMLLNPNVNNNEVEKVGRRINESIFWVFKGECDGGNA